MSLREIAVLYRARLRSRLVLIQETLALTGIAVGVALLFASQVASASLTGSFSHLVRQIVGQRQELQIEARGPDGFSERWLADVERLPGVKLTLPLLESEANVVGPRGTVSVDLLGADPRFDRAGGPLLRRYSAQQLTSQRALALPAPLAARIGVGSLEVFTVQVGARSVRTLLGATLGAPDIGGLVHSPIALTNIGYAQSLTGLRGRLSRIFVEPQPGEAGAVRDELRTVAAAAGANVEPATYDATLFSVASEPSRQSEALFAAISALVAFMFALNAMLVTVPARRRLVEELRPQGASRMMTLQILLFDAMVLAVAGGALGIVLGDALSIVAFNSTPDYLSFAFPVGNDRIVTWSSVLLALLAGLVAALIGVLWPLRDVLRGTFRGEEGPRPRTRPRVAGAALGAALIAGTIVIAALAPQAAVLASLMLIVALLCLLPLLFGVAVGLFDRLQRAFSSAAAVLAVTELRAPRTRVRSLAIAATAAVAVFGIVEFGGAQSSLQRGLDASARNIDSNAQIWVTPKGEANTFATTAFTLAPKTRAELAALARVEIYRGGFLNWGRRRLWVLAPPASAAQPVGAAQLRKGAPRAVEQRLREPGWAVLSEAVATEHHLRVGDTFVLPAPVPTRLRLAGISNNLAWPSGAIVLGSEVFARAWGSSAASAYWLTPNAGTSAAMLRQRVQEVLGPQAALAVETTHERELRHYASSRRGLSRLVEIRWLLTLAALLAVVGAMAATVWQRRDLIAAIKCEGYGRGVIWRWLCLENAFLVATGSAFGALFGLYGEYLASRYTAVVTGFPVVYSTGILAALASFALLSAIAVAIAALPGYLVARTPPRSVSPAY